MRCDWPLFSVAAWASLAPAQPLAIQRVVNWDTPRPGGGTYQSAFFTGAVPTGNGVAFSYLMNSAWQLDLVGPSGSRNVAGPSVLAPNGLPFLTCSVIGGDAGEIAFHGSTPTGGFPPASGGIFKQTATGIQQIITHNQPLPGSGVAYIGSHTAEFAGGMTVFDTPGGAPYSGVFAHTNDIVRIIDNTMSLPGIGVITPTGGVATDGTTVAFHGVGPLGQAIYSTKGTLHPVAHQGTPVPGAPGIAFSSVGPYVKVDDGEVMFTGTSTMGEGIYATTPLGLVELARSGDQLPGGFTISRFHAPSYEGGVSAFYAIDAEGEYRLCIADGLTLTQVIAPGDSLDGRVVLRVSNDPRVSALRDRVLVWNVDFTDGSRGVYSAVVPAPATLLLPILTVAVFRRHRACGGGHSVRGRPSSSRTEPWPMC